MTSPEPQAPIPGLPASGGPGPARSAGPANSGGAKERTARKTRGRKAAKPRPASGTRRDGRTRRTLAEASAGISLRTRVSLLVMVAVGLTVAVAAIVSYSVLSDQITRRLDTDLFNRAYIAANTAIGDPLWVTGEKNSGASQLVLTLAGLKESIVAPDGQVATPPPVTEVSSTGQATTVSLSAPVGAPELAVANGSEQRSARTVVASDGPYRVVSVPLPGSVGGGAIVLATSLATTDNTLHVLGTVSILVGIAGIAVAGTAGLWIGRAAFRPVERLTVAAEYIARTGDLRPIEVTGTDELARLTLSFNTMLLALARSQDYQKRLVADAGHELRTPLTSMRTNLDLLAQATAEPDNPRLSAQDRADLMTDVRAQMEELSVLISDLVELSRDEHPAHAVEEVDFAEIVDRAMLRVQRRAPSLTYTTDLKPWVLRGEPAALERMVTNLLDNAAKWSPPGGTVSARLHGGALQVSDQGPGIAEEDLAHVFERFYRSPEARTMPGSGLGLAIVRQVAENHGGHVAAARAPGGGALLGVWLPGTPGRPGPDHTAPEASADDPV